MGFELNNFKRPPIEREYKPRPDIPDGEGVILKLNLDLLTYEKMEEYDREYSKILSDTLDKTEHKPSVEDETMNAEAKANVALALEHGIYKFPRFTMELRARQLGGRPGEDDPDQRVIREWNVVSSGQSVPVSYEVLLAMPKNALDALYEFVLEEASRPTDDEKKR